MKYSIFSSIELRKGKNTTQEIGNCSVEYSWSVWLKLKRDVNWIGELFLRKLLYNTYDSLRKFHLPLSDNNCQTSILKDCEAGTFLSCLTGFQGFCIKNNLEMVALLKVGKQLVLIVYKHMTNTLRLLQWSFNLKIFNSYMSIILIDKII